MRKVIILIAVLMLFGSFSGYAFDGISPIKFTADGEITATISPDQTITASVEISSKADQGSYTLMLVNIKNNKISAIDADVQMNSGEGATLSATLTMDSDIEGCQLTAMLWDSVNTVKPLISSALLPGYKEGIKYLKAGDSMIEEFSPDVFSYNVDILENISVPLNITSPAFDGATEIKIKSTRRFPGKTVVEVTSPEKNTLSYTLNYFFDGTLCENLSYVGPYEENYSDESVIMHNLQNGAQAYLDNANITIENIPEQIKGSSYVALDAPIEEKTEPIISAWRGEDVSWYSFNLKRNAEIIIFAEDEISKFKESEDWKKNDKLSIEKLDFSKGSYSRLSYAYIKEISVTDESIEVSVPNPSVDTGDYFIVINYVYGGSDYTILEENDYVTELRYSGPSSSGSEKYFDHPRYFNNFSNGVFLFKNYSEIVAKDVADRLIGLDQIMMSSPKSTATTPTFINNAWGSGSYNWISFKLHKTAEVLVVVNSGNINALKNAGFIEEKASEGWVKLHNVTWNSDTVWDALYSKTYEVTDQPVTVNIPNPNGQGNRWGYIILINYKK